ncbi:MAG TPA: ribosome-associated translation inhibitor RaiA [Actinopolymorphaceae bacterium]
MDVVVQGRHCQVTDRFRQHVEEKIKRLERLTSRAIRIEVEVCRENTRSASQSERVELTVYSRGPLVRAEAAADDRFAALDLALDKLAARLRKAADRRRIHHGSRTPISVAEATAHLANITEPAGSLPGDVSAKQVSGQNGAASAPPSETKRDEVKTIAGIEVQGDGPLVVREKIHRARPMTLDQALYEMELVGHDFYLFIDAESQRPSVVYRRHGYDYGVIRLEEMSSEAAESASR